MAKQTITVVRDDLNGSELPAGSQSTRFGLNGIDYEIDLSVDNARALADALAPYIAAGRRAEVSKGSRRRVVSTDSGRLAAIRTWALSNGYTVSSRGRIAARIVEAYDAVH